ncbi:MAG: putative quinol monooxygenase [Rhizobiaceae bacterium]
MYIVCVEFELHEGRLEDFLPLMREQADNSLSLEEECLRFDVLQNSARADVVFLYEIYTSQAAFQSHLDSAHFKNFDAATVDLVKNKTVATYDQVYAPGDS